ncbi:MAG: hypothetical protein MUC92_10645 [Fimbriimonadaceae bacterium]|jgi:lipoate-protein ligase A|nr:hypothetical protein [Fimbriimonadaceae bacterium]
MIHVGWEGKRDGLLNMAIDCSLLIKAEEGMICARVYEWEGPWVSLGKFQRPEKVLLPDAPVQAAARPTGGKAVLHGHDLTIGMALPLLVLHEDQRSLVAIYRKVCGPITKALTNAGIPACLADKTPFVRSSGKTADCFAHVSPNDIVDPLSGRKVCGCALQVSAKAVLIQASIPIGEPLVDPCLVFDQPAKSFSELGRKATGIQLAQSLTQALSLSF